MTLIEIPQWGTMTLIEAIWLFSGVIALVFALLRVRPLYKDWSAARQAKEADLCVIAFGYFRREVIRLAQGVCIISIGLYAALEPSARPGPALVSITGLVITAVLILISLLVALQSYLDWRDRGEVKRIMEAQP